jgi:hypothetical protein
MYKHTTRTDLALDANQVDMGYHYTRLSEIVGDLNFNGDVNELDFNLFIIYWMNDNCTFPYYCDGRDFSQDGEVDFDDFAMFAENYQKTETNPPVPNPMTWKVAPRSYGTNTIMMTATAAVDRSGSKVWYEFVNVTTGQTFADTNDPNFSQTGLLNGKQYGYKVRAKDQRGNATKWSYIGYAIAGEDSTAPKPDPMTWDVEPYLYDSNTAKMIATTATDTCGVEYYFQEMTGHKGGTSSGWISTPTYMDYGLDANTIYIYVVRARDKSYRQNETVESSPEYVKTPAPGGDVNDSNDKAAPLPDPGIWVTTPVLIDENPYYYHTMTATIATDATPPIYYYFECTEGKALDSGWLYFADGVTPTYVSGPYWGATISTYRYRTKDAKGNLSGWSPAVQVK